MAEHQDLRVLGRLRPGEQGNPAENPKKNQVEQAHGHRSHLAGDQPSVLAKPQIRPCDRIAGTHRHSSGIYCDYLRAQEVEHRLALCLPGLPGSYAGSGRTIRLAFSAGAAGISPSVTGRCWRCCARTCTGPAWTPNGAATLRLS